MERCFICDKAIKGKPHVVFGTDRLPDGSQYRHHVGPECLRKVRAAGAEGFEQEIGPRLFFFAAWANDWTLTR